MLIFYYARSSAIIYVCRGLYEKHCDVVSFNISVRTIDDIAGKYILNIPASQELPDMFIYTNKNNKYLYYEDDVDLVCTGLHWRDMFNKAAAENIRAIQCARPSY
jgi:hypothetical protein